jgi:hypothetical protein
MGRIKSKEEAEAWLRYLEQSNIKVAQKYVEELERLAERKNWSVPDPTAFKVEMILDELLFGVGGAGMVTFTPEMIADLDKIHSVPSLISGLRSKGMFKREYLGEFVTEDSMTEEEYERRKRDKMLECAKNIEDLRVWGRTFGGGDMNEEG